jgi:hypothetical protein
MYRLSNSLYDRIRLEEAARAHAREYLRNADVPVWQIDPDELANRIITLEGLPIADDSAKAKACYMDQCRRVHAQMLRDAINAHRGNATEHIRPVQLLSISSESLKYLDDIANWNKDRDGDLLLAPKSSFNRINLAIALDAGTKVVHGYEFAYPRSVHNSRLPRGWCGHRTTGKGYALQREVAEVVWAASVIRAIQENDGDWEYTISHCMRI